MSTSDGGAARGTVNPTATHTSDLPATNGGSSPSTHGLRDSDAFTAPVIEQSTARPAFDDVDEQSRDRRDRVRWGPIWAGAAVVLTVFVVLQLLFFALGWLDLGFDGANGSGVTAAIVTGILALIAFFVGGLTAGASTMWRKSGDGLLHGVLVWALSVLGILTLALIGGSALLGPLADLASSAPHAAGAAAQNASTVDPAQALSAARQTAGWTALGLGLAVAAAAIGGVVGSKIWPGRNNNTAVATAVATTDHHAASSRI